MLDSDEAAISRLGAAVNAGDAVGVLACLSDDAVLLVPYPGDELSLCGETELRAALEALFGAFSQIRYSPQRRYVSLTLTTEEGLLTGRHSASFAGISATGRDVHITVRLLTELSEDGRIGRLTVAADLSSLLYQLGIEQRGGAGASAFALALRDQQLNALRVVRPSGQEAPTSASRWPITTGRRTRLSRRTLLLGGLGLAAMILAGTVLLGGFEQRPSAQSALTAGRAPSTPGRHPTPASVGTAAPLIASATTSTAPTVQPGAQLVLAADVLFGFNAATLTPAAGSSLTQLAARIRGGHVHGTIQINGYTDSLGSLSYDVALSRARALAVAVALQPLLRGVPVTLLPQGFGKADPVATSNTDTGRARNRRVTIVLPTSG